MLGLEKGNEPAAEPEWSSMMGNFVRRAVAWLALAGVAVGWAAVGSPRPRQDLKASNFG